MLGPVTLCGRSFLLKKRFIKGCRWCIIKKGIMGGFLLQRAGKLSAEWRDYMKISILSFSIKGCILSDKIEVYLEEEGHSVFAYALEKFAAVAGKIPFQRLEVVTARIFYESR